jgi:hypothetical protein
MSLTQNEAVFAGIRESGLNDILRAVFSTRPRYLNYGTPHFVPVDTPMATAIAPLAFPNVPGGLQLFMSIAIPEVDIHPDSHSGTWTLTPGPGEFAIKTRLTLEVLCGTDGEHTTAQVEVYAICRPVVLDTSPAAELMSIAVARVEIVTIEPAALESLVECLLLDMLRGMFANVKLPIARLALGAFTLVLAEAPAAENDQIVLRANAV